MSKKKLAIKLLRAVWFAFMKKIIRAILCLALFLGLGACKSRHTAEKSGFGDDDQVLRISCTEEFDSLDPRKARSLSTVTLLHMLYEGLMRLDFHGNPAPALASEMKVSPDKKTYTFKLRSSQWSNGDPLTSADFIRTWKTVLDPQFPAPNAYQFYLIKGARAAKEGTGKWEDVGISAPDSNTLIIELNEPAPYFPELACAHFFYPVHASQTAESPIGNGPFTLFNLQHHYELSVKKNPLYWDANEVRLDGVIMQILDEHTALRLFENGEVDWVGSPLAKLPSDAIPALKGQHLLRTANAAGVHWLRTQTLSPPFNNEKMRKAFALAIDRKALVELVLKGSQKPAEGIVPPTIAARSHPYFEDADIPAAWNAFQEALKEMDLSIDDLPEIVYCYPTDDRAHKTAQALQQQWFKALGVTVKLNRMEWQLFSQTVKQGNFQLASGSWFADFRDPINFLDLFKEKGQTTNLTGWENPDYAALLNQSSQESDPVKRMELLHKAEGILLAEMPVIPLYFAVYNYVKDDNLLGVYFSDLGYVDFKYAFFGD